MVSGHREAGRPELDGEATHDVINLPPDSTSARQARHFVRGVLGRVGLDDDTVETAELLTSELVTNGVLHARSQITVAVKIVEDSIYVEVGDENPRLPTLTSVTVDALSGRGLQLLQSVASRWGIESRDDGKVVWFELMASLAGRP